MKPIITRIGFGGFTSSYVVAVGTTHHQVMRYLLKSTPQERALGLTHRCTWEKCWRLDSNPERRLQLTPQEAARAVGSSCGDYLMLLRSTNLSPYHISTIAHESLHLVQLFTTTLGAKMNEETAEFFAYMLGDIVSNILEFVNEQRENEPHPKRRTRK